MRVLTMDRKAEHLKLKWQSLDVLAATEKALCPLASLTDGLSGVCNGVGLHLASSACSIAMTCNITSWCDTKECH